MQFPPSDEPDWRAIVRFAAPALLIFIANPVLTLIDSAFVGSVGGSTAQAALSPAAVILDFPQIVFSFLAVGTTNLISRELKREEKVASVLRVSWTLALACGALLLACNLAFAPHILRLLGTPAGVAAEALRYVGARRFFLPFVFLSTTSTAAFLSLRDPVTPLKWVACSSLVNVCLDYLLCVVLRLGIAGAGWATVAAQATLLAGLLWSLGSRGLLPRLWPPASVRQLAPFGRFAGPVSLLTLLRVAGFALMASFANSLGSNSLAAHQVVVSFFVLISICAEPLNSAGQTQLPALLPGGATPSVARATALVLTLVRAALVVGATSACLGATLLLGGGPFLAADASVYAEIRRVVLPCCSCLLLGACTVVLDGSLVARRDWGFLLPIQGTALCVLGGSLSLFRRVVPHVGLPSLWVAYLMYLLFRLFALGSRLAFVLRPAKAQP